MSRGRLTDMRESCTPNKTADTMRSAGWWNTMNPTMPTAMRTSSTRVVRWTPILSLSQPMTNLSSIDPSDSADTTKAANDAVNPMDSM